MKTDYCLPLITLLFSYWSCKTLGSKFLINWSLKGGAYVYRTNISIRLHQESSNRLLNCTPCKCVHFLKLSYPAMRARIYCYNETIILSCYQKIERNETKLKEFSVCLHVTRALKTQSPRSIIGLTYEEALRTQFQFHII